MTGPAASPRIGHVPALDGLRAIAVLAVMAYHGSAWASGGFLGVDVFFALSGFLITSLLVRERSQTGRISLRRFYARRALRLVPALLLMLGVYLALAALLDGARLGRHAVDAGSVVLMAANVPRALGIGRPVYLAPCWSLSLEEHFYVAWPLLLPWLSARVPSPRRLAGLIAGLALLAWAARVAALLSGADPSRLYYLLDGRADGLLIGCALGVLHGACEPSRELRAGARRALALAVGGIAIAWCALLVTARFDDAANHVWRFPFVAATTAVLILAVLCARDGAAARTLGWAPLAAIGRISYGLYLWHYPIFLALARDVGLTLAWTAAIGVPLAFAAAAASHRWVERPALRLKRRFA